MELATLTWPGSDDPEGDTFWFVSEDGYHFYEVSPAPRSAADVQPLQPLGGPRPGTNTYRMSMARRWLQIQDTHADRTVVFAELPTGPECPRCGGLWNRWGNCPSCGWPEEALTAEQRAKR